MVQRVQAGESTAHAYTNNPHTNRDLPRGRRHSPPTLNAAFSSSRPLLEGKTGVALSPGAADNESGIASSSCDAVNTRTFGNHTAPCTRSLRSLARWTRVAMDSRGRKDTALPPGTLAFFLGFGSGVLTHPRLVFMASLAEGRSHRSIYRASESGCSKMYRSDMLGPVFASSSNEQKAEVRLEGSMRPRLSPRSASGSSLATCERSRPSRPSSRCWTRRSSRKRRAGMSRVT